MLSSLLHTFILIVRNTNRGIKRWNLGATVPDKLICDCNGTLQHKAISLQPNNNPGLLKLQDAGRLSATLLILILVYTLSILYAGDTSLSEAGVATFPHASSYSKPQLLYKSTFIIKLYPKAL